MHVGTAYLRWRGKRSRHSWRMCIPQFYVSGKRPISQTIYELIIKTFKNTLTWKIIIRSSRVLHKSRQLSCRDMCKIVTRCIEQIKNRTKIICTRFQIWVHSPFSKWISDAEELQNGVASHDRWSFATGMYLRVDGRQPLLHSVNHLRTESLPGIRNILSVYLAATKQLMYGHVRPTVRHTFFTMFQSLYHQEKIFRSNCNWEK